MTTKHYPPVHWDNSVIYVTSTDYIVGSVFYYQTSCGRVGGARSFEEAVQRATHAIAAPIAPEWTKAEL